MAKITSEDWDDMEIAARSAVVAGGISAMGYYRGALAVPTVLEENLSPTTIADIQATLAILRSLSPSIAFISGKLNFGYSLFAEELEEKKNDEGEDLRKLLCIQRVTDQLGAIRPHIRRTTKDFRESFEHCIAILFDSIDGTTNFRAGIPLFCSAVVFLIQGRPCIGAIYDPHHNVVYYGSIRSNENEDAITTGYAWNVQSGSVSDLVEMKTDEAPNRLIATHLTRSNSGKREQLIKKLNALTVSSEGTYMLNSGQLALAYIANGNLTAFVNNYTNIWDVAAGEVLIRAIGGNITDFQGNPINYSGEDSKVDIVAASDKALHSEILRIVSNE